MNVGIQGNHVRNVERKSRSIQASTLAAESALFQILILRPVSVGLACQ
jgi:hypothetical protein